MAQRGFAADARSARAISKICQSSDSTSCGRCNERLLAREPVESAGFNNVEQLDFSKLSGRLLSYSVIPLPGEPRYEEMMQELKQLFGEHEENGEVEFLSETKVYWGKLT